MKNNETGEFEVVLGNRQLLSGFFIVVVLFGVFFTMGYIVGRNSAPSARTAAVAPEQAAAAQPETRPQPASGTAAAPAPPAETAPQPVAEGGAAPQTATQPVREPESAAPPAAPSAAPAEAAANTPAAPAPAEGDVYLQVMAVRRPVAEVVLKTLRDKGFRAVLGEGPNELVRVLVGPFSDTGSLGQAKAGLENAGFHPIVRK